MYSTFSTLSAAISGLYANKRALDTVSHNIANVDNASYVRQQVIQAAASYSNIGGDMQLGTGVNVQEIRQIRDEFLDIKYRDHAEDLGYWTTRDRVFEEVQGIFNELSETGLQNVMDQFWNSWEELAKQSDNLTMRGLLHERAVAFTETVNHMGQQLDNLQANLNTEIESRVSEINSIVKQVANLNKGIMEVESTGVTANDYRDTRNSLIDRLSQLANIQCTDDPSGSVNILLGGQSLVNTSNFRELSAVKAKSAFVDVYWKDSLTGGYTINPNSEKVDLNNGELKGLIDTRGDVDTTIVGQGNGTVTDDVDVVIAVDLTSSNLTEVENAIKNYRDDLNKRGLDARIKIVTFEASGNFTDVSGGFIDSSSLGDPSFGVGVADGINESFDTVVTEVTSMADYRADAHKKLIVFSDESIGGDSNSIGNTDVEDYVKTLNSLGISTSIVSDSAYQYDGDAGEKGWDAITHGTGGEFFDISRLISDNQGLAVDVSQNTSDTTSKYMGTVDDFKEVIPVLKQKLNTFVNTIARNINYLHEQGINLTGGTGDAFFVAANSSVPIQAGNIKVNPDLDILNNIAISESGEIGDGKIAEQISKIRNSYIFGDMTSDDYYRGLISDLGVAANEAVISKESQELLTQQVDDKRKSISNVSLDEEMKNMLQFQHSYVANSRVVNAVDEMIDFIINKTGRVGL
ncbi:flagellar hook-associated protein FlgK [Sporosalibacterium faouarense]|uniref:flagellar hook-associated protein FlgK n=1 Tax=Sporosalibacterium faouarense TaxID=516123 RepID=UPI00141CA4CE|nr:flagellar hook-associated protein FlgK [Sporosalibacterium faouarense]MTI46807.1 flagellar hook-associated protein FlgK [Bacillota bacterium]